VALGGAVPGQVHGEPYRLAGNRIVFTNWMYLRPGKHNWVDDDGNVVTASQSPIGDTGTQLRTYDMPRGLRLVAQPAQRRGPLFAERQPWEATGVSAVTLLPDTDGFRLWGHCQDEDKHRRPCCFESKDGYQWTRPKLKLAGGNGNSGSNLLEKLPGDFVFRDPAAPPEERYKTIGLREISREEYEDFKRRRPKDWEPLADRGDVPVVFGLSGATSPDGFHWTELPDLLNIEHADTQNTGYYDERLRKYVLYTRTWWLGDRHPDVPPGQGQAWFMSGRRAIGRTESDVFGKFPVSRSVLLPGPQLAPSEVLYTNCKTTVPGAPDQHLMFPAIWNMDSDATRIAMASSPDGVLWDWLPGPNVLETAEFGQFDGGSIFAVPNLVELPNRDFALPYTGFRYPHKYPRGAWKYDVGMAIWPQGRLVALQADELGEFSLTAIVPPGKRLRINASTERAGWIRIEAQDLNGELRMGRSFEACEAVVGDQPCSVVRWAGGDDLGGDQGQPVALRFQMKQAKIFALEFE